ncbi:MAG: CdaR family protein [Thermoflexales bacterium]|nr:CdaR family protein [Thermoflexales bacterium]
MCQLQAVAITFPRVGTPFWVTSGSNIVVMFQRTLRWLASNAGLLLLSVVLAFLVWAAASLQQDPILEDSFTVPVVVKPPQAALVVSSSSLPSTIAIRVRAPQSVLEALRTATPQAPVDLSAYDPGTYTLELQPVLNASPATVLTVRPPTATVVIDRAAQITLPVRVVTIGAPAIGYRALAPEAQPQVVTISGSQRLIAQVVSADIMVSLEGARTTVEQNARVQLRSAEGSLVSQLQVSPETVSVRVPLEQLSNYRDLAVRVRIFGQPANGYAVISVDYAPQVVTVFGPREAIQQLPDFIETFEVNISGSTQDVEKRVGLNVPPNVSLVGDNLSVLVRVRIEAQQGARTVPRRPRVIGLARPLTATVSPPGVDIVLAGPLPVLNALQENDVQVVVDVSGLAPGVHTIAPRIVTQQGLSVQSVLPAQLQVRITDESQP